MSKRKHTKGSDNVFADIGVPDAPDYLVKTDLARRIVQTIRQRGLTQSAAAHVLGIDQPKVSALMRGLLTGFSLERLLRFIGLLGAEIEIAIRDSRAPSRTHVLLGSLHERTEYKVFTPANSSGQYPLVVAIDKEDWRLAAPLISNRTRFEQGVE